VLKFIHDYNGIELATVKMNEYRDKSLDILKLLPQNTINEALQELCHYVTLRSK
jgi:geranylgeranyl pyrophosphate synthase